MFLRAARVAFLISLACVAFGQSERGTITGVVRDASGAVIPGAKVTITNPETNVSLDATTNGSGEYTVHQLWKSNRSTAGATPVRRLYLRKSCFIGLFSRTG